MAAFMCFSPRSLDPFSVVSYYMKWVISCACVMSPFPGKIRWGCTLEMGAFTELYIHTENINACV